MLPALYRHWSPAGPGARLSILIFHRVRPEPDWLCPFEIDARQFDRICRWLASWFNVLPLDRAVKLRAEGCLPERALAITFDDGYADNFQIAMPILQRYRLCSTFFIATGFVDGGIMWNDILIESVRQTRLGVLNLSEVDGGPPGRILLADHTQKRAALDTVIQRLKYLAPEARLAATARFARLLSAHPPGDLMLRSDEIKALHRGGMQIGAHTINHPILAGATCAVIETEMAGSRDMLAALTGERIGLFAYPNGKPGTDYDKRAVDVARRLGFDAAVSTVPGVAVPDSDCHELPRFTPWERDRLRFGWRLAQNLARAGRSA